MTDCTLCNTYDSAYSLEIMGDSGSQYIGMCDSCMPAVMADLMKACSAYRPDKASNLFSIRMAEFQKRLMDKVGDRVSSEMPDLPAVQISISEQTMEEHFWQKYGIEVGKYRERKK